MMKIIVTRNILLKTNMDRHEQMVAKAGKRRSLLAFGWLLVAIGLIPLCFIFPWLILLLIAVVGGFLIAVAVDDVSWI